MKDTYVNLDRTIKANITDIAQCFLKKKLHRKTSDNLTANIDNNNPISENSLKLAQWMLNSVNRNTHKGGFFIANTPDRIETQNHFIGFSTKQSRLDFFLEYREAFLDVMDDIVRSYDVGKREDYLTKLTGNEWIDEDDLYAVYGSIVVNTNDLSVRLQEIKEQVIISLVDDVIYFSLVQYQSLLSNCKKKRPSKCA